MEHSASCPNSIKAVQAAQNVYSVTPSTLKRRKSYVASLLDLRSKVSFPGPEIICGGWGDSIAHTQKQVVLLVKN